MGVTENMYQARKKKKGRGWLLFWLAFFMGVGGLFMLNLERIKGTVRESGVLDKLGRRDNAEADPDLDFQIRELLPDVALELSQEAWEVQPEGADQGEQTERAGTGVRAEQRAEQRADAPGRDEELPVLQGRTVERGLYLMKIDNNGTLLWAMVKRELPASESPLRDTLEALIKGPLIKEEKQGLISLIPRNVKLQNAFVRGTTAYISFNEDFLFNTFGVEGYAGQRSQIVLTATEFNNVKDVQILIDGKRVDFLGEGIWIGSPISRNML